MWRPDWQIPHNDVMGWVGGGGGILSLELLSYRVFGFTGFFLLLFAYLRQAAEGAHQDAHRGLGQVAAAQDRSEAQVNETGPSCSGHELFQILRPPKKKLEQK